MWAAVLWDLDGTLVDTEPTWMAAERDVAAQFGAEWTKDDGLAQVGNALPVTGAYLSARIDGALSAEVVVERLVAEVATSLHDDVPWRPGAAELVRALDADGIPQALVTMSYQPIASAVARHLPFRAVVTGDTVAQGKPHPEAYLTAAALLDVDPAKCLAIEDSPQGAMSANAAGCTVLVVPNFVEVPPAPGRWFRTTLSGLSPSSLTLSYQ